MKLSYFIRNIGTYVIFNLCLLTVAFGMEPDEIDHGTVKGILLNHLEKHPALLDASKDKDIVVFLGNTGAGKSTLINYLSGKQLKVDKHRIVLEDPNDPSAMAIGSGPNSATFLPALIQTDNLLLCDLPGFKDTRGTAQNLISACFIKRIIENASSVKFVFVAGIDQITSDRGSSFKDLFSKAKQLIPDIHIEGYSSLIITKSYIQDANELPDFLKTNVNLNDSGFEILDFLVEGQHIEQMSRPYNSIVNPHEKQNILNLILKTTSAKIKYFEAGAIYDTQEQLKIKKIYNVERRDNIERLLSHHIDVGQLASLDIKSLKEKRNYMRDNFCSDLHSVLEDSPLTKLLRSISEGLYKESWEDKNPTVTLLVEKIVSQINEEIKEKEKQEEERRRLQAEAALRQAQERARAEQERTYRAEQELREYKAREERKQEEAASKQAQERAREVAQQEAERYRQLEIQKQAEKKRQEEEAEKKHQEANAPQYVPSCYHSWRTPTPSDGGYYTIEGRRVFNCTSICNYCKARK